MISNIKRLCKEIITNYTIFVRGKIHQGELAYEETGIDTDLNKYRNLFLELLSLSLNLEDKSPTMNKVVKKEVISEINKSLSCRRYKRIVAYNKSLIYGTCAVIFDRVVKEILDGDLVGNR